MSNSSLRARKKAKQKVRDSQPQPKNTPKKTGGIKSVTPKSSAEEVVPKPKPARKKRTKKTAE